MKQSSESRRLFRKKDKPESNSILARIWRKMKKNPIAAFFLDILVIVATAMVLSLLIKAFLIRSFFIPSGSMMDTLQIDDRIIVNELVPNLVPVNRGDVVVFKDPGGWLYQQPVFANQQCKSFWHKFGNGFCWRQEIKRREYRRCCRNG